MGLGWGARPAVKGPAKTGPESLFSSPPTDGDAPFWFAVRADATAARRSSASHARPFNGRLQSRCMPKTESCVYQRHTHQLKRARHGPAAPLMHAAGRMLASFVLSSTHSPMHTPMHTRTHKAFAVMTPCSVKLHPFPHPRSSGERGAAMRHLLAVRQVARCRRAELVLRSSCGRSRWRAACSSPAWRCGCRRSCRRGCPHTRCRGCRGRR